MIVTLSNGEELDFPDEATPDQMRKYILKNHPDESKNISHKEEKKENVSQNWQDTFKEMLKQRNPSMEYAEQVQQARETPTGMALELPFFLMAPEFSFGKAATLINKIPKLGQYLTKALQTSIPQMGLSAGSAALSGESPIAPAAETGAITAPLSFLSQAITSRNPILRNISKIGQLGAGAGLGYLGGEGIGGQYGGFAGSLLGAGLGGRGLLPKTRARQKVFGDEALGNIESLNEKLEAGKRLGIHLTPAEASGLESAGTLQGTIAKTPEGSPVIRDFRKERVPLEEKAIQNVIDTFFPKGMETKRSELYKISNPEKIPSEELAKWKENEIYKTAEKNVQKDPTYRQKAKGLDKDSIEYQNLIKESMDDMIGQRLGKKKKKSAGIAIEFKNDFLNFLDKFSPKYEEARGVAQRGILQEKLYDFFNARKMTGLNFNKYLQNKKNYNQLQKNLSSLEGKATTEQEKQQLSKIQQDLKDMKLVFSELIPGQSARSASRTTESSTSSLRNAWDAFLRDLKKQFPQFSSDKLAAEMMTNPNWIKEYEKHLKTSKNWERTGKGLDLISKAFAQAIAQKAYE